MTAGIPIQTSMVSLLVIKGRESAPRVLLLRRASSYLRGVWSYVAGHIEAGEAGWQTACRELAEETGLMPAALYATSFCEQFLDAQSNTIEIVPAFVAFVNDAATVRLNGEHSDFRWLGFDEAGDAVPFGSQRELLAHVRREFIERVPSEFLRIDIDARAMPDPPPAAA